MFRRKLVPENWLATLVSGLAVFIVAAIAVYVLTGVWRDHGADDGGEGETSPVPAPTPAPATAPPASLSAGEILDRRLASGEISIKEYEKLVTVLARRQAAPVAAAAAAGTNGSSAVTAAV